MSGTCNVTKHNDHALLCFGSERHNALSFDLLEQMIESIINLNNEEALKLIVIQSEGDRTFCAGADVKELLAINDLKSATSFFYQFARLTLAIRNSPHTVIVRVQGKAIGGAIGIIAAADYVIASEYAQVRLSELYNGIGPFVVGPAIERKIGGANFNHLALNPLVWQSAQQAKSIGLYNELVADLNSVNERIKSKVDELSNYSRLVLQEIKKMMWSDVPSWDELLKERAAISGKLILTKEAKEAMQKLSR